MSPLFDPIVDTRSPFQSYSEISRLFNKLHHAALIWWSHHLPKEIAAAQYRDDPFDDSQPLVLTHHDINVRNIQLGEDGWPTLAFRPGLCGVLAAVLRVSCC